MSAILDMLRAKLKRAPATAIASTEISAEIDRRRADLDAARAKIEAAAEKRAFGLDSLDEAMMADADADATAAARAVEIAERAIGMLEAPLAEAMGVEKRGGKFQADVAVAKRRAAATQHRLETEYDHHAAALASILGDLADYHSLAEALSYHARALNETFSIPDLNVTMTVQGGGKGNDDLNREVERTVRRVLERYESEQRGLLSD